MIPKMRGKAVAKPRSALSQEPVVKLHGPGRDGRPAKVLQYALASCLAQSCGQGRVAEHLLHPVRKSGGKRIQVRGVEINQVTRFALDDDFRYSTDARRHDWRLTSHCLQDHEARSSGNPFCLVIRPLKKAYGLLGSMPKRARVSGDCCGL